MEGNVHSVLPIADTNIFTHVEIAEAGFSLEYMHCTASLLEAWLLFRDKFDLGAIVENDSIRAAFVLPSRGVAVNEPSVRLLSSLLLDEEYRTESLGPTL